MKKNMGTGDRITRLAISVGLFVLAWWVMSIIVALLALFVLFEAVSSWCAYYQIIGKNSCPTDRKNGKPRDR